MITLTIFDNQIIYVSNASSNEEVVREINQEMETYFNRGMTEDEKEQLFGDGEGDGQILVEKDGEKYTFTFLNESSEF